MNPFLKRLNNVLENSNPNLLSEVLIIDDHSDSPIDLWKNDTRVRIIRTGMSSLSCILYRTKCRLDQCSYFRRKQCKRPIFGIH